MLIPKDCQISKLIILWCCQKTGHFGKSVALNEVSSSGFLIINANSATRSLIYHCVTCRSLRGKLREQLMSELPSDRLQARISPIYILHCWLIWLFYHQKL